MKVTRVHPFTGQTNTLDLDITQEQLDRHAKGEFIQNVAPNLTADEREFIISGVLPGEFDELFSEDEDYDDDIIDDVAF